ncbi:hypothetical protein V8C34DRAFT_282044 [Trichoderma compactum]
MYKRKFENDPAVVCKRAKTDLPNITLNHCSYAFQAATLPLFSKPIDPTLFKKRKRPEEYETEASSDREARRIKYPRCLSPASKYQIFPKTSSEEESLGGLSQYWDTRAASRSSTPDDSPTSAAKDAIITIDVVLPIRLAKPQRPSPASKQTKIQMTRQKTPEIVKKQQPRKQQPRKQQIKETDKKQQIEETDKKQQPLKRQKQQPRRRQKQPSVFTPEWREYLDSALDHLGPVIR